MLIVQMKPEPEFNARSFRPQPRWDWWLTWYYGSAVCRKKSTRWRRRIGRLIFIKKLN